MKISVIGTGYLGATHAACMASLGHDVLGVDINEDRAEALNSGRSFFHEPGLNELLTQGMQSGRLQFTTDLHRAAEHAQVHFLTVGTPQQQDSYRADTRAIEEVTDALVPLLHGEHLIIGKSTVPVGTAQQLCQRIDETRCASGERSQVKVCWNPEFLREGHAVEDTLHPDRIVLGLPDPAVPMTSTGSTESTGTATIESLIRSIYSLPLAGDAEHDAPPLLVMNLPTAELVKVSANAYLATRVSFINAVGEVCEATGADVDVLSRALGADPRIGPHYLHAGLGFGGGCLPKDIRAFIASAADLGINGLPEMLRVVESVNLGQRDTLFSLVSESFGDDLRGRRITMLGASFKPGSDDLRDSPALAVARRLHQAGAHVTVYDPVAFVDADVRIPREIAELSIASTIAESLAGAEAVVVGTEWSEFRKLEPAVAFDWVSRPVIFDGRNCLSKSRWTSAGWSFHALGHQ